MTTSSDASRTMKDFAIKEAHALARKRGTKVTALFSDDLCGDVARFEILRRLRRRYPDSSAEARDNVIEICLSA